MHRVSQREQPLQVGRREHNVNCRRLPMLSGRHDGLQRFDRDARYVDLEREAVELGLWQRISPLQLDRILRRQDEERGREDVGFSQHRHPPLLHRFEQHNCVLGVARLISSASSRLVKTGPG